MTGSCGTPIATFNWNGKVRCRRRAAPCRCSKMPPARSRFATAIAGCGGRKSPHRRRRPPSSPHACRGRRPHQRDRPGLAPVPTICGTTAWRDIASTSNWPRTDAGGNGCNRKRPACGSCRTCGREEHAPTSATWPLFSTRTGSAASGRPACEASVQSAARSRSSRSTLGTCRSQPSRNRGGIRLRERDWNLPADDSDGVGNAEALGERHRTEIENGGHQMEPGTTATNRPAMARHSSRRRLPAPRRRRRHPDHPADARAREHSTDATLPERDGRRAAQRLGGELDQPGPTASCGVGKLNRPRFSDGLSPIWAIIYLTDHD
jgi:hypothetical protein